MIPPTTIITAVAVGTLQLSKSILYFLSFTIWSSFHQFPWKKKLVYWHTRNLRFGYESKPLHEIPTTKIVKVFGSGPSSPKCMCIYIYVYIYIYMCIYMYVNMYIYIYMPPIFHRYWSHWDGYWSLKRGTFTGIDPFAKRTPPDIRILPCPHASPAIIGRMVLRGDPSENAVPRSLIPIELYHSISLFTFVYCLMHVFDEIWHVKK